MFRKRLPLAATLITAVFIASIIPANSATIAGTKCTKLNSTKIASNIKYTCVKSGKKLVWNKGVQITQKQTPSKSQDQSQNTTKEPTVITWDNLISARSEISYTAWKRTSDIISASSAKLGKIEIFTGPNTTLRFQDIQSAYSLVSRAFPQYQEPANVLVVNYNFKDLNWATDLVKSRISAAEYQQMDRNEQGRLISSNCDASREDCRSGKQQTSPSGLALVLQGISNTLDNKDPTINMRAFTGMYEAHEYFHAVQRMPIMFKNVRTWPKVWYREGGAEWIQNAAINYKDFSKYAAFLKSDCAWLCVDMPESKILSFLELPGDQESYEGFDRYLNYNLGSRFMEILVAINGPSALLDMYVEMGNGLSFDDSFKKIFGINWSDAKPIMAKVVYLNLH